MLDEIRCDPVRRTLTLAWSDGVRTELPHARLRSRCGCAECRRARRAGTIAEVSDIAITGIVPYGANAVQLQFSDGHARGIFPFAYLRALGAEAPARSSPAAAD